MPRAISQVTSRNRRKKILKAAKGSRLGRRNQIRSARHGVHKALQYAYRDRRVRKREFRALWIQRISAAAKQAGTSYSVFMGKLNKAGIEIDRKQLAELAVSDPQAFRQLVDAVQPAA
ncbi:MAG: 50S ribosomal protein L20 [Candidatus Hinthialibacter sp.]